jgi:hypothetical protein
MLYKFYAHGMPSMLGEGDANTAARLCNLMNQHRADNVWYVRPVEKAHGPLMYIADEIHRHHVARGHK